MCTQQAAIEFASLKIVLSMCRACHALGLKAAVIGVVSGSVVPGAATLKLDTAAAVAGFSARLIASESYLYLQQLTSRLLADPSVSA